MVCSAFSIASESTRRAKTTFWAWHRLLRSDDKVSFEPELLKEAFYVSARVNLNPSCPPFTLSPIRRFTDLQVHCLVKRYLRRQAINDIMKKGGKIPDALTATDLGCNVPVLNASGGYDIDDVEIVDKDVDYADRAALLGAARTLQRESQRYWLLELIRRRKEKNQSVTYDSLVLGCVDPERRQYAVYVYDLGFECRYSTPVGSLRAGTILPLKVTNVIPRSGLITLTRAA